MKIAVACATGNIGARISRQLLAAGHRVRALSRGGPVLDELVKLGAEPFIGSFDEGKIDGAAAFAGMDAAFTMVRSDWENLFHYRQVATRLADALETSPVDLVVNLSAMGAELGEGAGHHSDFWRLEQMLNRAAPQRIVHLRGGWFMENYLGNIDSIARHGKLATLVPTDVKLPHIASCDVGDAAVREFLHPVSEAFTVRELRGSADLTLEEGAAAISREIGKPVEALQIDAERAAIRAGFLSRFGSPSQWEHRLATYAPYEDGHVRFHMPRTPENSQPTPFADFLRDVWRPAYDQAAATLDRRPETFAAWACGAS